MKKHLAALVALCLIVPAFGQEQYILGEEDDQWQLQPGVEPASAEGRLERIRRALAAEDFERAENLATRWIERYETDPNLPLAYLYRGDALRGRKRFYNALFDYEYVARAFPGSETFIKALERELEIATLIANGTKRRIWGMRFADASDEAEELLIRIQERVPGSSLAERAGLTLGAFYFDRREMALAAEAYAIFIENYPRSENVSLARRRLIYAHLAAFKGPEWDATGLVEARAKLRQLQVVEPSTAQQVGADAIMLRVDESYARKLLSTAQWYLKTNDAIGAEMFIRRLLRNYQHTPAARDALRLIPSILPNLPESVRKTAPDYEAYRAALLPDDSTNSDGDQP